MGGQKPILSHLAGEHELERDIMPVCIVIPVYNQLDYTRGCLESLRRNSDPRTRVILVDNASKDGTGGYLASQTDLTVITNQENRGCAGAWNQGVMAASPAEWVVILNNDVVVSSGWIEGLLEAADRWNLDIISPAIREGLLNYDVETNAREITTAMKDVIRTGIAHGICFMVHRRVFETIGLFDENFRIGQYEDTDFFLRATRAGFRLGVVGASFLHHFGSATQDSIRTARKARPYAAENRAYYIRKWRLPWWKRAVNRHRARLTSRLRSLRERMRHGHTLIEKWINGRLHYE